MTSLKIVAAFACIFLAVMVQSGDAWSLTCYQGIGPTTETCDVEGSAVCKKSTITDASGVVTTTRCCDVGCAPGVVEIDGTSTETKCCYSNLCNGAASVQFSILSLVMMIVATMYHL